MISTSFTVVRGQNEKNRTKKERRERIEYLEEVRQLLLTLLQVVGVLILRRISVVFLLKEQLTIILLDYYFYLYTSQRLA